MILKIKEIFKKLKQKSCKCLQKKDKEKGQ